MDPRADLHAGRRFHFIYFFTALLEDPVHPPPPHTLVSLDMDRFGGDGHGCTGFSPSSFTLTPCFSRSPLLIDWLCVCPIFSRLPFGIA
jgi:hypothetical protein